MSMLAAYLANAGTEELGNLPRQVAASVSAGVSKDGAQALRDVLPACTTARCALAARSGMHVLSDTCSAAHALTAFMMVRRLVLPVSRGVVAVTACLLVPGPAVFSFWDCLKDTEALSLITVTARRGFPSRSAAICAATGLPDAVQTLTRPRVVCSQLGRAVHGGGLRG